MTKKQALIDYLLETMGAMEKERGRRMSYSDFAEIVDLPLRTVTAMFDPDDDRLPIRPVAGKVAIGLGSNHILEILGYELIDETFLRFSRALRQLPQDQQQAIIHQMEAMAKKEVQPANQLVMM